MAGDTPLNCGYVNLLWQSGCQSVVEYVDHYAPARANGQDAVTARVVRLLASDGPTRTKQAAWAHLAPAGR